MSMPIAMTTMDCRGGSRELDQRSGAITDNHDAPCEFPRRDCPLRPVSAPPSMLFPLSSPLLPPLRCLTPGSGPIGCRKIKMADVKAKIKKQVRK